MGRRKKRSIGEVEERPSPDGAVAEEEATVEVASKDTSEIAGRLIETNQTADQPPKKKIKVEENEESMQTVGLKTEPTSVKDEDITDSPGEMDTAENSEEKKKEGEGNTEEVEAMKLDDEDVDGEGYEFVIHEDLDNLTTLTMQQSLNPTEEGTEGAGEGDESGPQFRFSHSSKSKSDTEVDQQAYQAMKHFGITSLNYHSFCSQIGRKHTPFEIDLTENDVALVGSDRPWRRPGASLDDFFNYGFNEHSWKDYAAKQVGLRLKKTKGVTEEDIQMQAQSQHMSGMYERY